MYLSVQSLGDQMEDYCGEEVVLDSDDEGRGLTEAANLVNGRFRVIGRFSGRGSIGSLKRKQVSAGCFRKLDNKVTEQLRIRYDSARSDMCYEKSDAGRASLSNGSSFQDCCVSVDSLPSSLTDQKPIPTSAEEIHMDEEFQNMVRESLVEDSLDERESHESKFMDTGKDANNDCEYAGLNYIQSPEVSESHDKALEFVDRYLSVSDLGSNKYVESRMTNRMQSPPSLWSKGSQCLARRVNLGCTLNKSTPFDWVENPIEKFEYASPRMNKGSVYGSEDDKYGYVSVNQDSGKVKMQNEIPVPQSEELPGSILSTDNFDRFVFKSDGIDKMGSNSGICATHDSSELDKQFDTGLSLQNGENDEEWMLNPDAFDAGLNTQMAAEAMEALMHASPLMVDACSAHQGSENTILDSPNNVNEKNNSKYLASYDEAFVGWRCKGKRSKCVKISTVDHTNVSLPAAKQLKNKRRTVSKLLLSQSLSTKKLMTGKVLNGRNRRKVEGAYLKLSSDSSSEVKTDTAKREENFNLELADRTLSKMNMWNYPKRKRSGHCLPCHSIRSSNQCSPCTAIENIVEKHPVVNEEANNRVKELLVYKRRRKFSVEREQIGSALKLAGHLYSSGKDNAVSDGLQNSVEFHTSVAPGKMKSDSITLQVLENTDKSKQACNPISKSPLMKELMRLGYTESLPDFPSKDSRRRRATEKVSILFSQNLNTSILKKQKKIVARLGFSTASCCSDATHFVTDRFMRTKNMLEAIALGKPVVTHLWLESCEQAGCLIDEKSYILRDEKKEKEIGFSMTVSLSLASQHPLLKGREVLITPNVKPGMDVVKGLVEAVHGQALENIRNTKTKVIADDLLILSCKEDYTTCLPFLEKGASIYDSELLLNGIITHKLEYERYKLFKDFMPPRRNGKMACAA
ncbi:hypothetical protein ABFS82_04G021600 [Erythranthe guttata]